MKILIKNGNVLLPDGLKKVDIEINAGVITKIGPLLKTDPSSKILDAAEKFILPGFIDIHTNGIAGFDLTSGLYDQVKKKFSIEKDKFLTGLDSSLNEYLKHGTTLVCYTSLEAPVKKLLKVFGLIAKYKQESQNHHRNVLHGIYMEGTFMKDKKYSGAHNPKYFTRPSKYLFDEFQAAAKGNIKIVNVVPEWGKSAFDLLEHLVSQNIVCAAGHTSATGVEYCRAIEKGISLAIHVLNGPSSSSFKPFNNGGALESLLKSDKIFVEIIPDGYHVDKAYVLDVIKRKGFDKCVAISDSMFIAKMKNIREFEINSIMGKINKNGKYIHIAGREEDNSLYGSVLTMDEAFSNLLTWFTNPIKGIWNKLHEPLSFEEALLHASEMCSANPAKVLGIYSFNKGSTNHISDTKGSIETGKCADIISTEILKTGRGFKLVIKDVILKGKQIKI